MRRKLDGDELDWRGVDIGRHRSAGLYVKHLLLRLARPASEEFGRRLNKAAKGATSRNNLAQSISYAKPLACNVIDVRLLDKTTVFAYRCHSNQRRRCNVCPTLIRSS